MNQSSPISLLMFGTILVVLGIAIWLLVRFRSRHNSHPMDNVRERNIDEIRSGRPPER